MFSQAFDGVYKFHKIKSIKIFNNLMIMSHMRQVKM